MSANSLPFIIPDNRAIHFGVGSRPALRPNHGQCGGKGHALYCDLAGGQPGEVAVPLLISPTARMTVGLTCKRKGQRWNHKDIRV